MDICRNQLTLMQRGGQMKVIKAIMYTQAHGGVAGIKQERLILQIRQFVFIRNSRTRIETLIFWENRGFIVTNYWYGPTTIIK